MGWNKEKYCDSIVTYLHKQFWPACVAVLPLIQLRRVHCDPNLYVYTIPVWAANKIKSCWNRKWKDFLLNKKGRLQKCFSLLVNQSRVHVFSCNVWFDATLWLSLFLMTPRVETICLVIQSAKWVSHEYITLVRTCDTLTLTALPKQNVICWPGHISKWCPFSDSPWIIHARWGEKSERWPGDFTANP